jgi:hypothetical protein
MIICHNVKTCGSPTCFNLFRPSSGKYSTKKNANNYVTGRYCVLLSGLPPWRWTKQAEKFRRTDTCLYIIESNYSEVVWIYILTFHVAKHSNSGLGCLIFQIHRSLTNRHTHTHTHTRTHTLARTPLNDWSARLRGHYLKQTQESNIHALRGNRTRDPRDRLQTYNLDRTATGVGNVNRTFMQISSLAWQI